MLQLVRVGIYIYTYIYIYSSLKILGIKICYTLIVVLENQSCVQFACRMCVYVSIDDVCVCVEVWPARTKW